MTSKNACSASSCFSFCGFAEDQLAPNSFHDHGVHAVQLTQYRLTRHRTQATEAGREHMKFALCLNGRNLLVPYETALGLRYRLTEFCILLI